MWFVFGFVQLKGFILNIAVDFLHIEITNKFQIELKT